MLERSQTQRQDHWLYLVFRLALIALMLIAIVQPCSAQEEERELLPTLVPRDIERFQTKDASVVQDQQTKALTITFQYSHGEPEVRIPVAQLGWPTDWAVYKAVAFTFQATSPEAFSVGFSDGVETSWLLMEPLAGIRIKGVLRFDASWQTVVPATLGYKAWPERLYARKRVEQIIFKMRYPSQPSQLTIYGFTLTRNLPHDDILDRKPLIDRYGQWIPEMWEDKSYSDEQLRTLWAKDTLQPEKYPFCSLGGDKTRHRRATGFFRTEQVEGKWVFVDPHGHPFYSTGMDLVGHDGSFATDISGRSYLFQKLPPRGPAWLTADKVVSFYVANVVQRFGEGWEGKWSANTLARLRNWGFNTVGNWSDKELATSSKMPYVLPLYGWTTKKTFSYPFNFPDVFSEEFAANVDAAAREQCASLKDDPNLIGWFVDNEPAWARETFTAGHSWADELLSDSESSATQTKLKQLLAAAPGNSDQIKADFLYVCARKYFETIAAAVRKHDPNHLVLGPRFAEEPSLRWARLSSVFDVFSINIYSETLAPKPELIRKWSESSGRPVLIGEFTAATPGRGLQGLFYGVHKVRDYKERGKAYRYYVENAAASPYIIGTHWFQMVDDLPTGRPGDGERMNYGFINVIDLPYRDLVEAAQQTHRRLYALKFGFAKPSKAVPAYN
jgi:hypothetical protein